MATDAAQLALPIQLQDSATLENFLFAESLGPLERALRTQLAPDGEPTLFIYGPRGSGRSHLLQAACQVLPPGEALYLPLAEIRDMPASELLAGVEVLQRICLDDVHRIAGDADWEQALFHLVNRARQSGCRLLFSADTAPRQLDIGLADLASRLGWGSVFQLPDLDDERKLAVLLFRAGRRGLGLEPEAGRFILSRAPRGMHELMAMLEQLDRDALAAKRQLTIPFIKERLGW